MSNAKYEAVVIGGSWGGTETVIDILGALPQGHCLPIILVLHRQRNVKSFLTEIFAKRLRMPVREVDDKAPVRPGVLYLAPSNYHVLIEKDRTFSLDISEEIAFSRPSIDVLFESASLVYNDRLAGILLTGANSDGSAGIAAIKARGGLTIVQDPSDAEADIMPLSAIARTEVDHVLPRTGIAELLRSLCS